MRGDKDLCEYCGSEKNKGQVCCYYSPHNIQALVEECDKLTEIDKLRKEEFDATEKVYESDAKLLTAQRDKALEQLADVEAVLEAARHDEHRHHNVTARRLVRNDKTNELECQCQTCKAIRNHDIAANKEG